MSLIESESYSNWVPLDQLIFVNLDNLKAALLPTNPHKNTPHIPQSHTYTHTHWKVKKSNSYHIYIYRYIYIDIYNSAP